MSQFYITIAGASDAIAAEPLNVDNIETARIEAVRRAGQVMNHHPRSVIASKDLRVEVIDELGTPLYAVVIMSCAHPVVPLYPPSP